MPNPTKTTVADPPIEPAKFALAQLRHLYMLMLDGHVKDTAEAARGLLGPSIARLETELAEWQAYGDLHTETRELWKSCEQAVDDIAEGRRAAESRAEQLQAAVYRYEERDAEVLPESFATLKEYVGHLKARAERAEADLHKPIKDWNPDMKRWLAGVLLKEAETVDGYTPQDIATLCNDRALARKERDEARALLKEAREAVGIADSLAPSSDGRAWENLAARIDAHLSLESKEP